MLLTTKDHKLLVMTIIAKKLRVSSIEEEEHQRYQQWKSSGTWYGLHKIRVSDRVSREAEP